MPALGVAEVTTAEQLEALAPEWTALWHRSPAATPFQSPAWLIPWWRHLGRGELSVVTVRSAGALVALVPLYVLEEPPARKLLPLGVSLSDYLDGLFDEAWAESAAAAALAHLARTADRWDLCDLHQLRPGSPLLRAAAPAGFRDRIAPQDPCPVLPLPATVDDLHRALPRGALQNLRFFRRRADKAGGVRCEAARADNLAPLLDLFLELHGVRWGARDRPGGVLADDAVRRLHRGAAPALLALGVLRLYALFLDERPIAAYYGFLARGRAYAYLTGFDPAHARLSPGTLVVAHAIEEAVREGAAEFDFLRGREPHKYRWGATDRPTWNRKLWREAGAPGTFTGQRS